MRNFKVSEKIEGSGEYILGSEKTGSHACYMAYGILKPGEQGRELKPGQGHEEIVFAIQGDLKLTGCHTDFLRQGQALHLQDEESVLVENPGDTPAIYVISGGHSGHGHH